MPSKEPQKHPLLPPNPPPQHSALALRLPGGARRLALPFSRWEGRPPTRPPRLWLAPVHTYIFEEVTPFRVLPPWPSKEKEPGACGLAVPSRPLSSALVTEAGLRLLPPEQFLTACFLTAPPSGQTEPREGSLALSPPAAPRTRRGVRNLQAPPCRPAGSVGLTPRTSWVTSLAVRLRHRCSCSHQETGNIENHHRDADG